MTWFISEPISAEESDTPHSVCWLNSNDISNGAASTHQDRRGGPILKPV